MNESAQLLLAGGVFLLLFNVGLGLRALMSGRETLLEARARLIEAQAEKLEAEAARQHGPTREDAA